MAEFLLLALMVLGIVAASFLVGYVMYKLFGAFGSLLILFMLD